MGNRMGKKAKDENPSRRKRSQKNGYKSGDKRKEVTSCPDLDTPAKDEVDLNITLYRSYDTSNYGSLKKSNLDIKIYRRSTEALSSKSLSLPRSFGRSRSTPSVPNGSTYPELRERRRLYDADNASDSEESRRTSATSSMTSLQGHRVGNVNQSDFPSTDRLKSKLNHFHTNFVRSLSDKFRCLTINEQLSNLAIALKTKKGSAPSPITLEEYLKGETVPLDISNAAEDGYLLTIPLALFHGIKHVRSDKLSEVDLWSSVAADVVICIAVEAGYELERMYEYQIGLVNEDASIQRLAGHAASCAIGYVLSNKRLLDRNSVIFGAIWGVPVKGEASPGLISIIIGNKELKWHVDEVFKKAALRREIFLFTNSVDPDEEHPPWQFFTSDSAVPMTYGYRGLLLDWDDVTGVFKVSTQDEKNFPEEMSYRYDDFHRSYCPYARLVGLSVMIDYCKQVPTLSGMPLAEFVHRKSGVTYSRDEIQPVYRPLGHPKSSTNFNFDKINLDGADLTRIRLTGVRLSGTSLKNTRLLNADCRRMDISQAVAAGAELSYSNLQGARIRTDTLRMITKNHVIVGNPPAPHGSDTVDSAATPVMITDAQGIMAPVETAIQEKALRATEERKEAEARATLSPQHLQPSPAVARLKKTRKKRSRSAVQVSGEGRRRADSNHLDVSRSSLPPVVVTQTPSPPQAPRSLGLEAEVIIRPQASASLQTSPVVPRPQKKAISASNITHQSLIRPERQAAYRGSGGKGAVSPRMVKSVSHSGQLTHNKSLAQSFTSADVEFLRKSQVFLIMKGLQIKNIESNLPSTIPPLRGRTRDIEAVVDLADADRVVTVTGAWGSGKSDLCLSAAKLLQEKFVCPVCINMRGAQSSGAVLRRFIRHFGLRFSLAELPMFYNWLNSHEQRLLLLFDNMDLPAEEDDRMSSALDDIMFHVRNARIICTSRRNFFRGEANHESYRLGDLSKHSEDFLRQMAPDLHDEGILELGKACSHLPFALQLVGNVFAMDDVDAGRLFEDLTSNIESPRSLKLEDEILRLSVNEYEQQNMRCEFNVIAKCLDNMPDIFSKILAQLSCYPTFHRENILEVLAKDDLNKLDETLTKLLELKMLEKLDGNKFTMISSVKVVAQMFVDNRGSQLAAYAKNGVSLLQKISKDYHSRQGLKALTAMSVNFDMIEDVLWRVIEREDAYEVLADFASLDAALFLQGELTEQIFVGMYESLDQQAEERGDKAVQVRALCALALYFTERKDVRHASQAIQKAYEIVHDQADTVGETEQALSLFCLGKLYWLDEDDRAQAQNFVKKALDIYKKCLGVKHLHTLFAFEQYGWMLTQTGNFQSARHFYNISDFTARELLDEHPLLIPGFDSRRAIWDRLSLFSRATDNAKKAMDIAQTFYGEHHITGAMLANYCESIMKRGSLSDAVSAAVGALAMRSMILGDHKDTAASYKAMASLMLRNGQYEEAGRFAQNALEVYERLNENERFKVEVRNLIAQARYRAEYRTSAFGQADTKKRVSRVGQLSLNKGVVSTDV